MQDFLTKYKAVVDFELNELRICNLERPVTLPITYLRQDSSYLTIPARSESIHYVDTKLKQECVISSQELCYGV